MHTQDRPSCADEAPYNYAKTTFVLSPSSSTYNSDPMVKSFLEKLCCRGGRGGRGGVIGIFSFMLLTTVIYMTTPAFSSTF